MYKPPLIVGFHSGKLLMLIMFLGCLHHVVVSDIAYISRVHAASIFWVDPEDGGSKYL
jgi:hypothetical protein